jgi:general stress protein 26
VKRMNGNWNAFTKFIETNREGALATVDDDKPHVRAVVFVSLDEENIIYTTTSVSSRKVKQIRQNPNVSFFIWKDHSFFRGEGKAEISEDESLKDRILIRNPQWKAHFPLGSKDPDYCLIKIKINKIENNVEKRQNKGGTK